MTRVSTALASPCPDKHTGWLALQRAPGLGEATLRALITRYPDPGAIFAAKAETLAAFGITEKTRKVLRTRDWSQVANDREWLNAPDHHLLTLTDPAYPVRVREIADPPPLLFVRGDPDYLNYPQIAVVGTRNPTPLGRETAHAFARELAAMGFVITSGLALGIDSTAHRGALAANGATVAVMGTGPDRVYPARNRDLALEIMEHGAIVSEFPLGSAPIPANFPRRNRIISALCLGVLVVEAATRSGSLITARLAGEQGREVFAIPGSIHNPMARGCHALLRQGAKLVECASDILEEIGPQDFMPREADTTGEVATRKNVPPEAATDQSLSGHPLPDGDYRRLLDNLGFEPTWVDVLVERTGLTAEVVSSMLLTLELRGEVLSFSGGCYMRAPDRPSDAAGNRNKA